MSKKWKFLHLKEIVPVFCYPAWESWWRETFQQALTFNLINQRKSHSLMVSRTGSEADMDVFWKLWHRFLTNNKIIKNSQKNFDHEPWLFLYKWSCYFSKVPRSRDLLDSSDVYILDMGLRLLQWNGAGSNKDERFMVKCTSWQMIIGPYEFMLAVYCCFLCHRTMLFHNNFA